MAQWKKPTKCKIGALTYKIKYVTPGETKALDKKEMGAIDQYNTTIYIEKEAPFQVQLVTLIHEFFHGIGFILYSNRSVAWREDLATACSELLVPCLQSAGLLPSCPKKYSYKKKK